MNFTSSLNDQEAILKVRNLTTWFQLDKKNYKVVDDLSFDLNKGKTLALVGESGCGKSMTAASIMRILPKPPALFSQGEVWYQEKNLLSLSEKEMSSIRGAGITMIFQDPMSSLNPVYTIGEQLMEVARWHLRVDKAEAFEIALKSLREVGITSSQERMRAYPHQLSGGMKQRVMIAMALMGKPDILIADEPTTALDVTIQAQILELMLQLQEKRGMAILLITHDMGVVAEMADDVIVMYSSQAIEKGSVWDIFDRMAHPYTKALFHSLPHESTFKGQLPAIGGNVPFLTKIPSGCRFHPRCPHAMECCKQQRAVDFLMGTSTHTASCWLYDPQLKNFPDVGDEK